MTISFFPELLDSVTVLTAPWWLASCSEELNVKIGCNGSRGSHL
jgi:hypothetical protein